MVHPSGEKKSAPKEVGNARKWPDTHVVHPSGENKSAPKGDLEILGMPETSWLRPSTPTRTLSPKCPPTPNPKRQNAGKGLMSLIEG
eukprot:6310359-Pyramimonas_sp.AAC.1